MPILRSHLSISLIVLTASACSWLLQLLLVRLVLHMFMLNMLFDACCNNLFPATTFVMQLHVASYLAYCSRRVELESATDASCVNKMTSEGKKVALGLLHSLKTAHRVFPAQIYARHHWFELAKLFVAPLLLAPGINSKRKFRASSSSKRIWFLVVLGSVKLGLEEVENPA